MATEPSETAAPTKITTLQGIIASGVTDGLSIAEAGRQAGIPDRRNAWDLYKTARERIGAQMDFWGVDERAIILKIRAKMSAQETKFFQKDGVVTDTREVEAHDIQLRATALAADLRGMTDVPSDGAIAGDVNVQIIHIGQVNAPVIEATPKDDGNVVVTPKKKRRARLPVYRGGI